MSWRDKSAAVICRVLDDTKGQPKEVIDKALHDAYPFGMSEFHPYKIWLNEIQVQRYGRGKRGMTTTAARKKMAEWESIYGKRMA